MKIKTLNSDKLELVKSLEINIQYCTDKKDCGNEKPFWFADVGKELHYAWGMGKTKEDAIKDICKEIEETYFMLKGEKLAKGMQKVWDYMQTIIKEK